MRALFAMLVVLAMPAAAFSQAAAAKPAAAPASSAGTQASAAPAPAESADGYTYNPDGRRDPFLSLLTGGTEPQTTAKRGEGAAGFTLGEISVRGIVESHGSLIAMVQGPDNRTYLIHSGDRLADGVVKSVTAQGLVVMQDIDDPLSIQKQREVRKLLRSLEDAKE
jgi:type IV pilus assembly protein PilP